MPQHSLLVTGGAGFIGANFVHHWHHRHPEDRIVVLDLLTYAADRSHLEPFEAVPQFCFIQGSILDTRLVIDVLLREEIDIIVHFAAESHVDRSIRRPGIFVETNIVGTHSLLMAAQNVWLDRTRGKTHRFHHVSTDEVFGSLSQTDPPVDEDAPYKPNSPYAASKAAADHLVRAYHNTYGLQTTISHCSNNYGPMQFPEKLIPLAINHVLQGRPIGIYGDGSNVRDWIHVQDHCHGLSLILERGLPGTSYAIGGQYECSNIELVRRICHLIDDEFDRDSTLARRYPQSPRARGTQSEQLITFVADRPGHDWRYALNGAKIARSLGFSPRIGLDEGLKDTLRWVLDHSHRWNGHAIPPP